ncbi:hypothetical protein Bbelb_420660 [Branchiostoma belcheri]|nr:hypothetical protein Bbelb_420660 [Branchiostoma belcheri]
MASTGSVVGGFVSVLVLIAAVYYVRQPNDAILQNRLEKVLLSLLKAEKKASLSSRPRVAVGLGACQDAFVDALELFDRYNLTPPALTAHYDSIHDHQELAQMFAYFFNHGAAAERYMDNTTLFRDLMDIVYKMPNARFELGGNAPVMANRFAAEGCNVLLGAHLSSNLKEVMREGITVTGEEIEEDDIHLILEYPRQSSWGKYISPRANRFIVHSDRNNPSLNSLESFSQMLKDFNPSLVVVGGIQMMDNFPFSAGERESRLKLLQQMLVSIPVEQKTHFELASFTEQALFEEVLKYIVPYMDSLGMNEQELPNLYSMLHGGKITLISDPVPRVATVLDHMRKVWATLQKADAGGSKRRLSRLHVHTLAFQAIMTKKDSGWKNTMSAAAKASLTANRHVCGSPKIDLGKATVLMDESFSTSRKEGSLRIPFKENRPVSCWEEHDYEICIAPVLVCTEVRQTAGGGDNISSAGLVLQI